MLACGNSSFFLVFVGLTPILCVISSRSKFSSLLLMKLHKTEMLGINSFIFAPPYHKNLVGIYKPVGTCPEPYFDTT